MNKIIISEEQLNNVIAKSINEALEDEGLGKWLGNAYQWTRNKLNNFKQDFNAGRNNQRFQNRDYDPYAKYSNADDLRNFGADSYRTYRYDKTADRNNAATQYSTASKYIGGPNNNGQQQGTNPLNTTEPQANPDINQQNAPQTQNTPQAQSAPQQQNNNQFNIPNPAQYLKQKGFQLVNDQWIYTRDGSNSPALQSQYPDIVQAAKSYAAAMRGQQVQESKLRLNEKELTALIVECVKNVINKK